MTKHLYHKHGLSSLVAMCSYEGDIRKGLGEYGPWERKARSKNWFYCFSEAKYDLVYPILIEVRYQRITSENTDQIVTKEQTDICKQIEQNEQTISEIKKNHINPDTIYAAVFGQTKHVPVRFLVKFLDELISIIGLSELATKRNDVLSPGLRGR